MISRPRLKASTLSLVVLVALSLNGCASKKVWSPELEAATAKYQEVSQDPVVVALASEELAVAERQLAVAQDAYDWYEPRIAVQHEANVAKLRALTAQQRARALSANHKLQVALGQQPLLSEETILAATPPRGLFEPIMAAGTPLESRDQIIAHLAVLTQQIAALQNQLEINPDAPQLAQQKNAPASASNRKLAGLPTQPLTADAIASTEPTLGAAIPADNIQPGNLPSAKDLHRELLAMNARSSSRGMALTLGDRYFEGRSARLWTKRADRHLDNVASFLERNPGLSLDIEAHTDDEATSEENHDLSLDRADALKSQLVLRGVAETRISTTGFGESRPIAGNDNTLGRLQNRRVELIFPNIPSKKI